MLNSDPQSTAEDGWVTLPNSQRWEHSAMVPYDFNGIPNCPTEDVKVLAHAR